MSELEIHLSGINISQSGFVNDLEQPEAPDFWNNMTDRLHRDFEKSGRIVIQFEIRNR